MVNHPNRSTAARLYRARRTAERAAGLMLIERIEAGATLADLCGKAGPIQSGRVVGTDMEPAALIALCGASRERRCRALAAIRA